MSAPATHTEPVKHNCISCGHEPVLPKREGWICDVCARVAEKARKRGWKGD